MPREENPQQRNPVEIRADRITLPSTGQPRIVLEAAEDGPASISLLDSDGRTAAQVYTGRPDGTEGHGFCSGILVRGPDESSISLETNGNGTVGILISELDPQSRLHENVLHLTPEWAMLHGEGEPRELATRKPAEKPREAAHDALLSAAREALGLRIEVTEGDRRDDLERLTLRLALVVGNPPRGYSSARVELASKSFTLSRPETEARRKADPESWHAEQVRDFVADLTSSPGGLFAGRTSDAGRMFTASALLAAPVVEKGRGEERSERGSLY